MAITYLKGFFFFFLNGPCGQSTATISLSLLGRCVPPSLSLLSHFQPCTSRLFIHDFCRSPVSEGENKPDVGEEQPLMNICLGSRLETSSGGAPAGHRSSRLRHYFWLIPASSDLLSWWNHLFWNKNSTLYKTIPILSVESSPLKSLLLFTSCFLRLFLVNRDSFLGWEPPNLDVLFISFCLIYIGYILRTFGNHVLQNRIVNLNCLDLRAGLTKGRNWKLRPPLNSFWHHKSSGSLKITTRAFVKKCIFRGKIVAPFCVKVWFVNFLDFVLENEHTPRLVLMSRVQF